MVAIWKMQLALQEEVQEAVAEAAWAQSAQIGEPIWPRNPLEVDTPRVLNLVQG